MSQQATPVTTSTTSVSSVVASRIERVCVLGLGYVGFPTALLYARCGFQVTGVDINMALLGELQQHVLPKAYEEYSPWWQEVMADHQFLATSAPVEADAYIVAVPTPFDPDTKHCDLVAVKAAVQSILPVLKPGNLVILESTVPPGTTRTVIQPMIESTGLVVGDTVHLCFCPERVLPGNTIVEMVHNDRVVGGVTLACAQRGQQLLESIVRGEVFITDDATAEFCKLAENTYRDVNIALANELAKVAAQVGVNIQEALPIINRHPRVNLHRPGIGVGGHCIAVDPWFLVQAAPEQSPLIRQARQINDSQPDVIVDELLTMVAGIEQPKIVLLGLTYKPNVADVRESPAMKIFETLKQNHEVEVIAFDPLLPDYQQPELSQAVQGADLLAVLVGHAVVQNRLSEERQALLSAMRTPQIKVY